MNELTLKAKSLIESIKNEISELDEVLDFHQQEHGIDSDNIEALEYLLEQVQILTGKPMSA